MNKKDCIEKPFLEKIYEPDENKVHYMPPPGLDQVTLCGLTDWIGNTKGYITTKPLTCFQCKRLVDWIHEHKKPTSIKKGRI